MGIYIRKNPEVRWLNDYIYMGVSKNDGTRKSSILIGISMKKTIHFGIPLFLETSIFHLEFLAVSRSGFLV